MGTKLTLRLDEKLINGAKKLARSKGISLSRLVSDYFNSLSSVKSEDKVKESPILSEIAGILSLEADNKELLKDYKEHTREKYL